MPPSALRVLTLLFSGLLVLFALAAADRGVPAQLLGGTLSDIPAKSGGHFDLTGEEVLRVDFKRLSLEIPYDHIHTLEYGQRVSRRYAEAILISPVLLLAKTRKHFVTIGYTDANGHNQALVFQFGKSEIRTILASLEARTGRKVEYQDEEARRAGKG